MNAPPLVQQARPFRVETTKFSPAVTHIAQKHSHVIVRVRLRITTRASAVKHDARQPIAVEALKAGADLTKNGVNSNQEYSPLQAIAAR